MATATSKMNASQIKAGLARFCNGTDKYHRLIGGVLLTDGVRYLMEAADAMWLMIDIASHQVEKHPWFQLWELRVKDGKGELTMREDRDSPVLARENYYVTD